jgi:indolepyruvate ferredoxin oxidoreductase
VPQIARQVAAEGAKRVVIVSDEPKKYPSDTEWPNGITFHHRDELDDVQRELAAIDGCTVLIYDQTCAAEKRRRRKKGELVDPARRIFINERVCEGCGDCSVQSNCVAVLPHETPLGRKRKIDQSSCNKDYSCVKGFCPSFVGVLGGALRKKAGALESGKADFERRVAALPQPRPHVWTGPYDLLVTGVGGTGVVTVGAVIAMAAHLEGHAASVLDFMGFAQKGGSVLSFVRLAQDPSALNQVRIDAQQADAMLACDIVVAASADALQTVRRGRTRVLANTHEIPVAESLSNPDASLKVDALLEKLEFAAGADRVETMDAQTLAEDFLGDTIVSNIVAMGYAWQRGLVPVALAAMQRAIELNGVAVESNKAAFSLGRLAAADPVACRELLHEPDPASRHAETVDELIERSARFLVAYQGPAYAERYRRQVAAVRAREEAVSGTAGGLPLTRAVATQLRKLMAYKDEYEVARLYTDGEFEKRLAEQFEGKPTLEFYMAPPALVKPKGKGRAALPKKRRFGPWMFPLLKVLAHGKALRGTALDPFGRTEERKLERQLIADYEARVAELLAGLSPEKSAVAVAIANVPGGVRGYGHVKLASLAIARAREKELLNRFDPERYPRPSGPAVAGQFRGIPVTSA